MNSIDAKLDWRDASTRICFTGIDAIYNEAGLACPTCGLGNMHLATVRTNPEEHSVTLTFAGECQHAARYRFATCRGVTRVTMSVANIEPSQCWADLDGAQ